MAFSSSFSLFLIFSLLIFTQAQAQAQTPKEEQDSLYKALSLINPTISWKTLYPDDLCLFSSPHGVVCSFFPDSQNATVLTPHITELSFGHVSDTSPYPPCSQNSTFPLSLLSHLPYLTKLFFYKCFENENGAVLLPTFPKHSVLEELVFIENPSLSGSLSESKIFLNFPNLKRVIITGSNISGGLSVEITKLPFLEQVTISGNKILGGEIPKNIGLLKNLKVLDLSENGLMGNVPFSLGELNLLIKLDLSHNELMGKIPESLKGLEKVEFLDLSYNKFGNFGVPLFLGEMGNLKEVYLSGNKLGGIIPEIWENLGGIIGIGLSNVGLVGNIPVSMGVFLRNLCYLWLDGNMLEGNVPKEFGLLEHLHEMNLRDNQLSGRIPFSAPFVAKIGGKLKVEGNLGLCVDKSVKKNVVKRMGKLGNLRTCSESESNTTQVLYDSDHINGCPSLCLNRYVVVFLVGFWSFCWLW